MNVLRTLGAALVATAVAGCAAPTPTPPAAPTPAAAPAAAVPFAQAFNTLGNGIEARNVSFASAMRSKGADVSICLARDARHGFGYGGPLMERPQAIKALNAPVVYFDAQGVLLDPWTQQAVPGADDAAILKMMAPFISRGVNVGSKDGQMKDFVADLVAYFSARLR